MKIKEIWFDNENIYARDEEGHDYAQSLLWYPRLLAATDEQRNQYHFGLDGIHWRNLDEDISFESFTYEDAQPSPMQRFFLTHTEIDLDNFSSSIGLPAKQLRNHINGFDKPSHETEQRILSHIHRLGNEMANVQF